MGLFIPASSSIFSGTSSTPIIGTSTTAATLITANINRKSINITNTSLLATCFILFGLGTVITTSNYSIRLSPGDFLHVNDSTDAIQYILSSAGSVNAQELI